MEPGPRRAPSLPRLPGTHLPSAPLCDGGRPRKCSCPNVPQVPESCRVAPAAPQLRLPRGWAAHRIQEMASMSKSPGAAAHKDRAARGQPGTPAATGPLAPLGSGTQVTAGGAGSGPGRTAGLLLPVPEANPCWWEVLSVSQPATDSTGARTLTQRLLPGRPGQGQRPNGKQPPGKGWAEGPLTSALSSGPWSREPGLVCLEPLETSADPSTQIRAPVPDRLVSPPCELGDPWGASTLLPP